MKEISLEIVVWKEGENYVSWCLNNGVSSFGESKQEALESLKEALGLYFEDMSANEITKIEKPELTPMNFTYA